tara:strand:- start:10845 stop:11294 length:450 start_codon:yes stop_codon:yes gene_type:complete
MAYNPPSYGGYERAKNDTQYKYTQDATTNAYSRFISQQRGKRNLGDMQNNYKQSFPEQTAQFGQRGISAGGINSGIMNNSMNRFVGNYAQQQGRATQDLSSELQQYDLGQLGMDSWRDRQLASIEADKQAAIANDAAQLDYWRQTIGSM